MNGYCLCIYLIFFFFFGIGKYYLVDAEYSLRNGYLKPYKGEKYHLPDFRRAGRGNKIEERFKYFKANFWSVEE